LFPLPPEGQEILFRSLGATMSIILLWRRWTPRSKNGSGVLYVLGLTSS